MIGPHFSDAIDWAQPWLAHHRQLGPSLAQAAKACNDLPAALNAAALAPVRFVPQAVLPDGVAYESHIYETGGVPTREGLHDFFNALCWMRFPQTKQALNRMQAQAIEQAGGVGSTRGPLRDGLTLFDENVVLLHMPDAMWQALLAHDWAALFIGYRDAWAGVRWELFGHALVESLVQPFKSITGHVLCLNMPPHPAGWDAWLATHLTPQWLATKPFAPLPVMGIPGWAPCQLEAGFYQDTTVFRPLRPGKKARPLLEMPFVATI